MHKTLVLLLTYLLLEIWLSISFMSLLKRQLWHCSSCPSRYVCQFFFASPAGQVILYYGPINYNYFARGLVCHLLMTVWCNTD